MTNVSLSHFGRRGKFPWSSTSSTFSNVCSVFRTASVFSVDNLSPLLFFSPFVSATPGARESIRARVGRGPRTETFSLTGGICSVTKEFGDSPCAEMIS